MKVLLFCGNYDKRILEEAKKVGEVYYFENKSLREILQEHKTAEIVFINSGHIDIEMLEDNQSLLGLVCPEDVLEEIGISAVSALGVVTLQMPSANQYTQEWDVIFSEINKVLDRKITEFAVDKNVYHHPNWKRIFI